MTEKKADPAYIITESELKTITHGTLSFARAKHGGDMQKYMDEVGLSLHKVRSRPHNPASGINPTESDGRGYRCLHCEIRNGSLFCHYHDVRIVSLQEHNEQVKWEAREEVLDEICAINKRDGCCNGQPHGKDCFDCEFIHLRSEVKKQ